MRAMYPKSPAKRRWGIHRANILPPRGVFAVRSPQIMHGAQILPFPDEPGPCSGVPTPPAPRQYLPLAVPITVRDKPPVNFGGDHSARGLQFGQAPRDLRLHHLDGQADNGMLCRTGPEFQNREQVGVEPPTEAAGPAGPASALPKTPIERTNPSWRNYRNSPKPGGIGVVPVYFHHAICTRLKQHFPTVGSDFRKEKNSHFRYCFACDFEYCACGVVCSYCSFVVVRRRA